LLENSTCRSVWLNLKSGVFFQSKLRGGHSGLY
jgi:hypothetical protein